MRLRVLLYLAVLGASVWFILDDFARSVGLDAEADCFCEDFEVPGAIDAVCDVSRTGTGFNKFICVQRDGTVSVFLGDQA
jgi:hypothetical protein